MGIRFQKVEETIGAISKQGILQSMTPKVVHTRMSLVVTESIDRGCALNCGGKLFALVQESMRCHMRFGI